MNDRKHHVTCDIATTCTLGCFACRRQSYRVQGIPLTGNGRNMPLGDYEKLAKYFETSSFCGQISDPIFHPDLPGILSIGERFGSPISIHTAATTKKRGLDWYKECFSQGQSSTWIFGLDGLPEESEMHRINQDGEFLWEVMKLASSMDISVIWQYIVFRYNQDHINEAKMMAEDHNIALQLNYSARWTGYLPGSKVRTELDFLKPRAEFVIPDPARNDGNLGKGVDKLVPRCTSSNEKDRSAIAYVNTGFLLPCCWIDGIGERHDKQIPEILQPHLKLENNPDVESIIFSDEWKSFYDRITNTPERAPHQCWSHCTNYTGCSRGHDSRRKRVFV